MNMTSKNKGGIIMKRAVKLLSLVLTITLICGLFAACDSEKKVSTGDKYTYWGILDTTVAQTLTSYSELLMYQEMTKRTGTEIDFIHPAQGTTGSEAFQILMASGDFPDMIEYGWIEYTGGPDQAIEDGVIIALNDYMEDYAPNYYDYMEGKKAEENGYTYKLTSISEKGNYYGFKNLNVGNYRGYVGLYVRADLLKKWNLDIPTTIDQWELLFKTAKKNGIKYPLTGNADIVGAISGNYFSTAWKVGTEFYLDGDKVKFGPFEPEFKEYVEKMREWMAAGYIDIDYVTNDTTVIHGQITRGTSIAASGYVGSDLGAIIPAMKERNPEFDLVACPYPVMNEGEEPVFQAMQPAATGPSIAITVQCGADNEDRYKEAISWCDYLYSDEGMILKSFGVEGDTFTIEKDENGEEHFVYTDKVLDYEKFGATNMSAALYHFMLPANHPGFNQHPDYFNGYYVYDRQKEAISVWNKHVDVAEKYVFPSVSYTGKEAARKAEIESNAMDNLEADISNIILGKIPMEEYEKVISKARNSGYGELLEINQAAYNRYIDILDK